jgi:hypothetical protein
MARPNTDQGNCLGNGCKLYVHLLPTKEALPRWIIQKVLYLCIEMEYLRGRSLEYFIGL